MLACFLVFYGSCSGVHARLVDTEEVRGAEAGPALWLLALVGRLGRDVCFVVLCERDIKFHRLGRLLSFTWRQR